MKTRWQIAPDLTVLPTRGGYWVTGRTGAYFCHPTRGTCGCLHFQSRLHPGDRCRHLRALDGYLWRAQFQQETRQRTK